MKAELTRISLCAFYYKSTNIPIEFIVIKNLMTLQGFVMNTDTKFHENSSISSLSEAFEPAEKYDPPYTVLVHVCHRIMIK